MQIEFGIDETGDRRPDRFDPHPDQVAMAGAVAARVYLLLRSVQPVVGQLDDRFYQLGSKRVPAANDRYFRRVMQTTVLLRNAGVFR